MSVLGLGTVKLGRNVGVKYPTGADGRPVPLPSDEQAVAVLSAAVDLGVTLIDTAPAYGKSESRLGELMTENRWFGGRDRWVVCTKAGEEFDSERAMSRFDFSAEGVTASVERSLRRLRIDTIDVVLLHSDGRDEWILRESGGVDALERLCLRGLVRAIGISVKSPAGWRAANQRLASTKAGAVMVEFDPALDEHRALAAESWALGLGVLVKKGLASGHAPNPAASIRGIVAEEHVSSLIVGTTNAQHLVLNAKSAAGRRGRKRGGGGGS